YTHVCNPYRSKLHLLAQRMSPEPNHLVPVRHSTFLFFRRTTDCDTAFRQGSAERGRSGVTAFGTVGMVRGGRRSDGVCESAAARVQAQEAFEQNRAAFTAATQRYRKGQRII
ncbi:hypothetical protein, partial [Acetobacter oeni]|uniref:hypothetical protein n=1 Tax=Acetobacter oeni TaxID=304077 RepID=UPI00222F24D2